MSPIIVDQEVTLKLPNPGRDAAPLVAAITASQTAFFPWLPWAEAGLTVADEERRLMGMLGRYAADETLELIIHYQDRPVGYIAFREIDHWNRWAELGYWLDSRVTGRGIVHRAVSGLVRYGFTHGGLEKVFLLAASDNRPSNRVAQAAGFHLDGTRRHNCRLTDGYHDEHDWSLLRTDWQTSGEGASPDEHYD